MSDFVRFVIAPFIAGWMATSGAFGEIYDGLGGLRARWRRAWRRPDWSRFAVTRGSFAPVMVRGSGTAGDPYVVLDPASVTDVVWRPWDPYTPEER